jgi:hypothetical protein
VTGDVLEELLQLEEGGGKVRDHPVREERRVGVSSPWKGIDGVGGPKCGEERRRFGHWRGREVEGKGKVLTRSAHRGEKKERGSMARWLAVLTDAAVEKKKKRGSGLGCTTRRSSWGRAWGTGAAVGQRGVAGTDPELACMSRWHTLVHNRGGGVAARGARL